MAFTGDETLRAKIDELASKNTEGLLTEEERAEYEGYVRANNFMSILQVSCRAQEVESSRPRSFERGGSATLRKPSGGKPLRVLRPESRQVLWPHVHRVHLPLQHHGGDDADNRY